MTVEEPTTTIQSKTTESVLRCPSCHHEDVVYTWDLLEATCNPEAASFLASGTLLLHTCSECKALLPLDYPLFFVDRDRKVAAYYPAGQGDPQAVRAVFEQATNRFAFVSLATLKAQGFALRLVSERYQLVEKTLAWRSGLDDRVLEVLKVALLRDLVRMNPDSGLCDLQFTGLLGADGKPAQEFGPQTRLGFAPMAPTVLEDGTRAVAPLGDTIAVPAAAYLRLSELPQMKDEIEAHSQRGADAVVDGVWATAVLMAADQAGQR